MGIKKRSAGVVPLRLDNDGWRVLLLRAYKNWDFPKGRVEAGEDLFATARREALEEAALHDLTFPWGSRSMDTVPYSRGKIATYFLGRTERRDVVLPVNPELGHPEHHEGRWLTFDEAERLVPARLAPILRWARNCSGRGGL